jgi:3-hydroxyisobutyrate dehydrogenase-like beta-hydroxyacid dehydrogenase
MKSTPTIGFIGFGEAGFGIAKGLAAAGVSAISSYDINRDTVVLGEKIRRRAHDSGVRLLASSAELAANSHILFSTVTADRAMEAAEQTAAFLESRHTYADLNSVSPQLKKSIAAVISARGARFVEAAIMSPVAGHGHRVPMFLSGVDAPGLVEILSPYGMNLDVISEHIGAASAAKMCRSIVVKGLEALLLECVLAAVPYGADERVFSTLDETFPGMNWKKLASYMTGRVVEHGERRARELEEAAATLRGLGIEPIMAEAAARRQEWCGRLKLQAKFGGEAPADYREVVKAITQACETERKD